MWNYTDKVKDHFLNPRNVGEIENPDAVGEVGSLACGDALKLSLKLDENEKIIDAKFQTFGCASAIASSSALTEMIIGLTLDEAEQITNEHIAKYLGGLPKEKMHCSVMGRDALEKAIACYKKEPEKKIDGKIVCECFGVTDKEIERAVKENNLATVEDVTSYIKAGGGCGNCHEKIEEIITSITGTEFTKKQEDMSVMTNLKKMRLIEKILEEEIKPILQNDGGDIELIDIDGDNVYVKLTGACAGCSRSKITLKIRVQGLLQDRVSPNITVKEVN